MKTKDRNKKEQSKHPFLQTNNHLQIEIFTGSGVASYRNCHLSLEKEKNHVGLPTELDPNYGSRGESCTPAWRSPKRDFHNPRHKTMDLKNEPRKYA
jgi:hypothetical protein